MKEELIIAGFGGQGVLSMGKILAYAGLMEDREVSWMPSCGTANVTVILSDEQISSPILNRFHTAIVLNQQSLDKFENQVVPGGTLIYDAYGIHRPPVRTDINVYRICAMEQSFKLKNSKTFNMLVLGALIKVRPIVKLESIIAGLRKALPERLHHLLPLNQEALELGMTLID